MAKQLLSIGETVAALRSDFPGITISKIRFLEAEGLVVPLRTPSGYRKFTPSHLERIRYVLTVQRDHYLPLKVIAEHLDALDRGLQPPPLADATPRAPEAGEGPANAAADATLDLDTGVRLTATEVCRESGLSPEELQEAVEQGLLPDHGAYDLNDVQTARAIAALAGLGLTSRNLRPVLLSVRRERDLHELAVGSQRASESDREYRDRAEEVANRILQLHVALTRQAMR